MRYIDKSDLTSIANVLRELNHTSIAFSYPIGFVEALKNIKYENFEHDYGVILGMDNPVYGGYNNNYSANGRYGPTEILFHLFEDIGLSRPAITYLSFPFSNFFPPMSFASVCPEVIEVNFKMLSTIPYQCFAQLYSLTKVNFPICKEIGQYGFAHCSKLQETNFPLVQKIGSDAFRFCSSLSIISFPNCTQISNFAFRSCYKLQSIYLQGNSIVTLIDSNAFINTPITNSSYLSGIYGSIYLYKRLQDSYLASKPWQLLSDRLVFI